MAVGSREGGWGGEVADERVDEGTPRGPSGHRVWPLKDSAGMPVPELSLWSWGIHLPIFLPHC